MKEEHHIYVPRLCSCSIKKVDYIEKYLGDEEPFNDAVLTHR